MLADQAMTNFPYVAMSGSDNDDSPSEGDGVLGVSGLFEDLPMDAGAYRAVASLLFRPPSKSAQRSMLFRDFTPQTTIRVERSGLDLIKWACDNFWEGKSAVGDIWRPDEVFDVDQ